MPSWKRDHQPVPESPRNPESHFEQPMPVDLLRDYLERASRDIESEYKFREADDALGHRLWALENAAKYVARCKLNCDDYALQNPSAQVSYEACRPNNHEGFGREAREPSDRQFSYAIIKLARENETPEPPLPNM